MATVTRFAGGNGLGGLVYYDYDDQPKHRHKSGATVGACCDAQRASSMGLTGVSVKLFLSTRQENDMSALKTLVLLLTLALLLLPARVPPPASPCCGEGLPAQTQLHRPPPASPVLP